MAEEKNKSECIYICLNVTPHFVLSHEPYSTYVAPYIQATNLPYIYLSPNETWGTTILDTILKIHQLIQQSLILLQKSESNVTEVAYQVGFNSTSYFIDKFWKTMNMTPLAYKKYKTDNCQVPNIKKSLHDL